MGVLCHNLPIDLNGDSTVDDDDNLLLCAETPEAAESQAPAGAAAFLDGAPQNAAQFDATFPYLTTPLPNDEPVIFDPDSLQADINQAFGSANDTPVAINSNDTVNDIFERVQ